LLNRRNMDRFASGSTVGGQDNPGTKSKGKGDQLVQGEDKGGATGVMATHTVQGKVVQRLHSSSIIYTLPSIFP
jgi:hypothetical protein